MAKQIYIDENGNEQLVSGTINNAEMLPISSGSATNTKAYIDSVVESGSNADGYYIKYKDGTMICTKKVTITVNQNEWTSWGQLYESPAKSFGNFAETFYATPTINLTVSGDACWIECLSGQSTTSAGQSRVVRPTVPGVVLTSYIQVIAIGRWKA